MIGTILLGFVLGIAGSFIASYLYDILREYMASKKLDIEGTWGEFVRDSKGRQFSLGKIYRDRRRRIYAFDGTNFRNDGTAYCHWVTINSHIDREHGQFFYTFRAHVEDEPDKHYYGFGVVNLAPNDKDELSPMNGHYVSASVDGTGMTHSMVRSTRLEYRRSVQGKTVIEFVRENTPARNTRQPRQKS